MFHACVQKFNVMGTVENYLWTKQGQICEPQEKGNRAMYRVLFNWNRAQIVFIKKTETGQTRVQDKLQPWYNFKKKGAKF